MSNVFVIIKICYVHNQWYDISCATLYIIHLKAFLFNLNNVLLSEYMYIFSESQVIAHDVKPGFGIFLIR